MSIFDVRHQVTAQDTLQRALRSAHLPHAYIFHGPEGVGKQMLAMRLGGLQLCRQPTSVERPPSEYADRCQDWLDSCGACKDCQLMRSTSHPDCHVVHRQLIKYHDDAAVRSRKGLDLGIDVIRQFVIDAIGRKASMGGHKVFLIQDADKLTNSAQNALLKTLEEPPPQSTIILLTRSLERMLPTTRSRCQLVSFKLLPREFVAERIGALREGLGGHEARFFARHEPGSLGLALQLIDYGMHARTRSLCEALIVAERTQATVLAKQIEDLAQETAKSIKLREPDISDSDALRQGVFAVLAVVATLYRDVLHLVCASGLGVCNSDLESSLRSLSDGMDPSAVRQAIQAVAAAEAQLRFNANTRLCLENLVIQLARLHAA